MRRSATWLSRAGQAAASAQRCRRSGSIPSQVGIDLQCRQCVRLQGPAWLICLVLSCLFVWRETTVAKRGHQHEPPTPVVKRGPILTTFLGSVVDDPSGGEQIHDQGPDPPPEPPSTAGPTCSDSPHQVVVLNKIRHIPTNQHVVRPKDSFGRVWANIGQHSMARCEESENRGSGGPRDFQKEIGPGSFSSSPSNGSSKNLSNTGLQGGAALEDPLTRHL